jgi:hypothetical protein
MFLHAQNGLRKVLEKPAIRSPYHPGSSSETPYHPGSENPYFPDLIHLKRLIQQALLMLSYSSLLSRSGAKGLIGPFNRPLTCQKALGMDTDGSWSEMQEQLESLLRQIIKDQQRAEKLRVQNLRQRQQREQQLASILR